MFQQSFSYGLRSITRRKGLVFLAYGLHLALAFIIAVPVYSVLSDVVGPTGFGNDLVGNFDLVLWADIMEEAGAALGGLMAQLLWVVPLYLLGQAALGVGLIHALRDEGVRPFWSGVEQYTGRALLLALVFALPFIVLLIGTGVVVATGLATWGGEVGIFWVLFVLGPTLFISGLAVLDLMHDYARMALVIEERPVWQAFRVGVAWPFKHGVASHLYVAWFAVAAVVLLIPSFLESALPTAIWGLFLLQQVFMILRAAVTVGWIGSEVALFEQVRYEEMPLIAEAEEDPPVEDLSIDSAGDGLAIA